jgi:hypothetical protein
MSVFQTYLLYLLHTARAPDILPALVAWCIPVMVACAVLSLLADAAFKLFGDD